MYLGKAPGERERDREVEVVAEVRGHETMAPLPTKRRRMYGKDVREWNVLPAEGEDGKTGEAVIVS